jgi:16S rRNA (cytidine1402-2'-O)-methyltransferase
MTAKTYHIGPAGFEAPALTSGLYLVATPIGNLGDITLRALCTLAAADAIYCEDTRVTGKLLGRYGIRTPMRNYHEHNAAKARPEIIAALQAGKVIALASDAGTPLVSDPGFKLVEAAVAEGLAVTALPGASAALPALQLSALPSDRFAFLGFLPEKTAQRTRVLDSIRTLTMTSIFYESPHRILDTLADVDRVLGSRPIAVARELTKLHEEVLRGTAAEVGTKLAARSSVKGEIALVIAAMRDNDQSTDEMTIEAAITAALETLPAGRAAGHVAKALGVPRDDIYARILRRKAADDQAD